VGGDVVGGLLVGLVSGGALATVLRASYEDAQRKRERLLAAAEAFLATASDAAACLQSFEDAARQFVEVRHELLEAIRKRLGEIASDPEDPPKGDPEFTPIARAMVDLDAAISRFLADETEQASIRLNETSNALSEAIGELPDSTEYDVVRSSLSGLANRFIPSGQLMRRKFFSAEAAWRTTDHALPRLLILFGTPGASFVTREAAAAVAAFSQWLNEIKTALLEDRIPASEEVGSHSRSAAEAIAGFAVAVNERTEQRWWHLFGD